MSISCSHPALLLLSATLLLPTLAAAGEGDKVDLTFNWPVGLSSAAQYNRTVTEAAGGDAERKYVTRASWLESVSEAGADLSIDIADYKWEALQMAEPQKGFFDVKPILARVVDAMPPMTIERAGWFKGVHDTDPVREHVRAGYAAIKELKDQPKLREQIEGMITDASLSGYAQGHWNVIVGTYNTMVLHEGKVLETRTPIPMQALQDRKVDLVQHLSVTGGQPCAARDDAPFCVRIELKTFPDPEQVAAALADLKGSGTEAVSIPSSLKNSNVSILITEPSTLIPWSLEVTRDDQTTEDDSKGKSVTSRTIDKRRWSWAHPDRSRVKAPPAAETKQLEQWRPADVLKSTSKKKKKGKKRKGKKK